MVDWNSLECILEEIGLPRKFTSWIMKMVTIVSYRFNVNGEYSYLLQAMRGIRQGDPISPLLFVILMEYRNRTMVKMQKNKDFKHHNKCKKQAITHLYFADDVLLFRRGDVKSMERMFEAFKCFSGSTGLTVNHNKCMIFCGGMDNDVAVTIQDSTEFAIGQLPIRYSDVPLLSKKLNMNHYLPMVERITSRIRHWTAKLLSRAGRIQLVNIITTAIAQYWMNCLPLPKFVIHKIDALCRSFVWTGKSEVSRKSLVAWKKTCSPIQQGGLNMINLEIWNSITLLKCLWNLCKKMDNMWVKWVHAYYLKGKTVQAVSIPNSCSWILKTIIKKRSLIPIIQQQWEAMITKNRFVMKDLYLQLIDDQSRVDWRNLMRNNYARPRALITLWLGCHRRLATKDRLVKMGMI
ncbi:uncharacterized protein LOC131628600 [Vicia villosa]|uniref:uncharacterized protein LOC131628600 n=1 Tax=Vicia villosa TaxID=3911 RepID=UPI00273C9686|nr:uncharacterized protein LOC131628600 [Vicia villosa]